jgi:NAD(P)-dependent dehydrogenase (short-subunit alcohol dehydrogenase family)
MRYELKRVGEQVIVITGASSGIGLATARMAAERGARVVLSSRDEADLRRAVEDIRSRGGRATHVVADVADAEAVRAVADAAVKEFGRIDTWVNNAGVSIYGRLEEVTLEDARRLFETNYWGVVNGSLAALPYLRRDGGVLVNVGSVLSDVGYPLQGHYAASKHAVKGFTDSLRLELEESEAPVAVTLIQPAAIDTPYPEHARNYLDVEPQHMPPVYAAEVVADAILACAERPQRDVLVGGGAKMFRAMEYWTPRLDDRFKEATAFSGQRSGLRARHGDTLHAPRPGDGRVRGSYPGHVMRSSAYTKARLSRGPALLGIAIVGAGLAYAARSGALRRDRWSDRSAEGGGRHEPSHW